jgi:hypothetical protein
MNFNPMSHGTENDTKSTHYPVMYLCSHRLYLTPTLHEESGCLGLGGPGV